MTHGEHEHEGDPLRALLAALTAKPPPAPVVLLDVRHDRECPAPERGGLACRCQPEVRVYLTRWPDWPAEGRRGTRGRPDI